MISIRGLARINRTSGERGNPEYPAHPGSIQKNLIPWAAYLTYADLPSARLEEAESRARDKGERFESESPGKGGAQFQGRGVPSGTPHPEEQLAGALAAPPGTTRERSARIFNDRFESPL